VLSARWSGASENVDQANLDLVLEQIKDVPTESRGAKFVCAAVAVFPDGQELIAIGEMLGHLLSAPTGKNGFGYDPIFVPQGFEISTAQMSAAEKDAISHRGKALNQLAHQISEVISKY
jgi:XTP/dITP diphosphohydrolase